MAGKRDFPIGQRVSLADGTPDEAILSLDEANHVFGQVTQTSAKVTTVDAERARLLIESARIRLAYAHDRQFAVSLSGIRTLPHQIEAVYLKMLPQPRLRFLLADDPGAGKTIMAGLLLKEMKLRQAIERILILCPAPLTIQWQDELLRWFGEVIRTRMAVQVKKWKLKNRVQAPVVQQVRGSLGTHEQGLIITTSDFSKGAREEAMRPNAVPVALMNGEQLVALLAANDIGVTRRSHDIIELDDVVDLAQGCQE